jgi:hypothetical protein
VILPFLYKEVLLAVLARTHADVGLQMLLELCHINHKMLRRVLGFFHWATRQAVRAGADDE